MIMFIVHATLDMSSLILLLSRPQRINQCNVSKKEKNKPHSSVNKLWDSLRNSLTNGI